MAHFSIFASVPVADEVADEVADVVVSGVDVEHPATINRARDRTRIF